MNSCLLISWHILGHLCSYYILSWYWVGASTARYWGENMFLFCAFMGTCGLSVILNILLEKVKMWQRLSENPVHVPCTCLQHPPARIPPAGSAGQPTPELPGNLCPPEQPWQWELETKYLGQIYGHTSASASVPWLCSWYAGCFSSDCLQLKLQWNRRLWFVALMKNIIISVFSNLTRLLHNGSVL